MRKHLYCMASISLILAACSDKDITPEDNNSEVITPDKTVAEYSPLSHVKLNVTPSDPSRVTNFIGTRAEGELEPGELKLIAEIANPSKNEGSDFTLDSGEDARYLSATCVYYDEKNKRYIATYHMQGNNYNTQLSREVGGFIETFTIDKNGNVSPQNIYRSDNPSQLDFDFNHLYFDNYEDHLNVATDVKEDRIIAVGHNWTPGSTEKGVTKAIIAKLNLEGDPSIDFKVVYTGDKVLDEEGKSLGPEDAQDVNCVVRRYDTYFLATRKGIALVRATDDDLFEPSYDYNLKNYFIKTKGSVKHVAGRIGNYNQVNFLYLTDDFRENFQYDDELVAKFARFETSNLQASFIDPKFEGKRFEFLGGYSKVMQYINNDNVNNEDFLSYAFEKYDLKNPVSPVDGKNVLFHIDSDYFAALGKGGLYYNVWQPERAEGYIDFGNRPVNGVFVDSGIQGDRHNGHIYVANGSKLSIFTRDKRTEVTSYNLPPKSDGSANFVVVRTAEEENADGSHDRIVTVAFGQEGIKVFRFRPKPTF